MQLVWRSLVTDFKVSAKPQGIWTQVLEYVGPSRKLRIKARGSWTWQGPAAGAPAAEEARTCGPDGDPEIAPSADALSQDALMGALIAKIGGSSAVIKNTGCVVAGSFCVIDVDDDTRGPLFLTINDTPTGMADNSGELTVSVWEAF